MWELGVRVRTRPVTREAVMLIGRPFPSPSLLFSLDVVDGGVVVVDEDGAEAEERARFIIREET